MRAFFAWLDSGAVARVIDAALSLAAVWVLVLVYVEVREALRR